MAFREPAPDNVKGDDNLPILVLPIGTVLKGGYKITSYVASGGMSVVYSAIRYGEKYLIKEVEHTDAQKVIALNQEKFLLERLNHPGIIKVFDLFEQDGFYYLALEYIDGESMDKVISPFPDVFIQENIILNWALQLCDIFEYLHKQNPPVIYRDLKPENLMKDKNGHIHLIDFGIARSFKQGKSKDTQAMGSALTASPEHYGSKQTDERSDIFTLGATLNIFITNGKGETEEPCIFAPVRSINTRISENMEQVIKKAIELDPRKRYQNVKEMRQALLNTRETPLPVVEPFGKGNKKSAKMDEEAGKKTGEEKQSPLMIHPSFPSFAMGLLCALLIFIVVIITWNTTRQHDKGNSAANQASSFSMPGDGKPSDQQTARPENSLTCIDTVTHYVEQSSPEVSNQPIVPSPTVFTEKISPSPAVVSTTSAQTAPELCPTSDQPSPRARIFENRKRPRPVKTLLQRLLKDD